MVSNFSHFIALQREGRLLSTWLIESSVALKLRSGRSLYIEMHRSCIRKYMWSKKSCACCQIAHLILKVVMYIRLCFDSGWLSRIVSGHDIRIVILQTCGDPGISAFPEGDNIFSWIGTIKGSNATVYEGLSYKLTLKFPTDYPFKPPVVKFDARCFHPNVDQSGNICLDILQVLICCPVSIGSKCLVELKLISYFANYMIRCPG